MEQKIVDIQKIISDYKIIEKSNDKGELFHLIRYAMKEACSQAIKLAAENATLLEDGIDIGEEYLMEKDNTFYRDVLFNVNKQSILKTINQIQ